MGINFLKVHGTGNDFVIIVDPDDTQRLHPERIAKLCDRHFGIGADGLIRITKKDDRWFMDYRNSDGSDALMCGNGARCFVRALMTECDVSIEKDLVFLTRGGLRTAMLDEDGYIAINMGKANKTEHATVVLGDRKYVGSGWELPNPHVVVFCQDKREFETIFAEYIPFVQAYPNGVNIEFAYCNENNNIDMSVYERGSGRTLACGTGACAVACEYWDINGYAGRVKINTEGGMLYSWKSKAGDVFLSGEDTIVAKGTIVDG